jgi:ABC-type multidrug transport system ATPase subunit
MSACDRVIMMQDGEIRMEGTMEELTKSQLFNDIIY